MVDQSEQKLQFFSLSDDIINYFYDAKWDKNELLFNDNFDISWVNECQNIKWIFGLMTKSKNFKISYILNFFEVNSGTPPYVWNLLVYTKC